MIIMLIKIDDCLDSGARCIKYYRVFRYFQIKYSSFSKLQCRLLNEKHLTMSSFFFPLQMVVLLSCSCLLWQPPQTWHNNSVRQNITAICLLCHEETVAWEIQSRERQDASRQKNHRPHSFSKVKFWKFDLLNFFFFITFMLLSNPYHESTVHVLLISPILLLKNMYMVEI